MQCTKELCRVNYGQLEFTHDHQRRAKLKKEAESWPEDAAASRAAAAAAGAAVAAPVELAQGGGAEVASLAVLASRVAPEPLGRLLRGSPDELRAPVSKAPAIAEAKAARQQPRQASFCPREPPQVALSLKGPQSGLSELEAMLTGWPLQAPQWKVGRTALQL